MDKSGIIIYQTEDGQTKVDAIFSGETVWLSLNQMADLFQRDKSTISRHIKNVFEEGELDRKVVVAKFTTTTHHGAIEGKTQTHETEFYNLDVSEVDKNSVISILETTAADKVGERSSLCRDDIKKGRFTGKNHGSGGAPSSPWMAAAIRSGFLAAMRHWHGHRRCVSPRMMDPS